MTCRRTTRPPKTADVIPLRPGGRVVVVETVARCPCVSVQRPPISRASRASRAFTQTEDRQLVGLWRSMRPVTDLNVELAEFAQAWGRSLGDLCRRIDFLIGPGGVADGRLTPIERALFVLAGRADENRRADGGFTLDGRPADCGDVVAAANRVLSALGHPVIAWPGLAVVAAGGRKGKGRAG